MHKICTIFAYFFHHLYFQKVFKCSICDVMKGTKTQIDKHITTHNRDLYFCHICSKSCDDTYHLHEHEDTHVHEGQKLYECTEILLNEKSCRCRYSAHGSLRTHMTAAHKEGLKTSSYRCRQDVKYKTMHEYKDCMKKEPAAMYSMSYK